MIPMEENNRGPVAPGKGRAGGRGQSQRGDMPGWGPYESVSPEHRCMDSTPRVLRLKNWELYSRVGSIIPRVCIKKERKEDRKV